MCECVCVCDTCADMEYSTQLDTMTSLSSKVLVSALVSCLSALNLQSIVKGMESWRKGLCSWQPYTACVCGCVYVYVNVCEFSLSFVTTESG